MRRVVLVIGVGLWASLIARSCGRAEAGADSAGAPSQVISLDGDQWLLAPDPKNVGRQEQWWKRARPGAKRTKVPWIIQDAFPGYHGVAWYWRDFEAPDNDRPQGRYLLRFWAVDYTAEVWLNGARVRFRDFRFENGAFRLNGKRIYLRCGHTSNSCPVGQEMPHDPDILRRDLLNAKAMRFNAVRFLFSGAKRYQLDLCDEIGLMVYEEAFDRPEDFFAQSIARMAGQRLLGLNAIRSNPNVVGHSLTSIVDGGMNAEGLWTEFRDLKPGTTDAVFDGFAPLRWCLFVEPVHVYRKARVRLEAVLGNEDALRPGKYPARLEVVGPGAARVFHRCITVTIPDPKGKPEPPMVFPVFAEHVVIDGPPGKYRFLATLDQGAAAAGGEVEFYVADAAQMPPLEAVVTLWGEDAELARWLAERGIRTRPFAIGATAKRGFVSWAARN